MNTVPDYQLFHDFFWDNYPWSALDNEELLSMSVCTITDYIYVFHRYSYGKGVPTSEELVTYIHRIDAELENRRR